MLGNRKIAALCLSKVQNSVCNQLVAALNECMKKINFGLMVLNTCSDLYHQGVVSAGEASIFELLNNDIIDIIIIYEEQLKQENVVGSILKRASQNNVPVIFIGEKHDGYVNITFDYEAGFAEMVRHVINVHNPEKIHYMNGMRNNDFSENRLNVFKSVLEEYNIPFSDDMVSYGDFWSGPAREAIIKLIEIDNIPDAVICANDAMAISVANTFKDYGYKVPDDVIVTGFDGIEDIYYVEPRITSSMCSYSDLAEQVTDIIPDVLSRTLTEGSFYVVPKLQLMQSCGCSDEVGFNVSQALNTRGNALNRYLGEERVLAEISAKIQSCGTIEQVSESLKRSVIYDMCFMLTMDCIDETINPLIAQVGSKFGDTLYVVMDTDYIDNFTPYKFPAKDIVPNLGELFDKGCAVIFTALNFLDVPLGYACFHYYNYDIQQYNKIPQTVTALNNAIGGFRNMRHQHYLREQIEEMYKFDTLTGLYNRGGFAKAYKNLFQNKNTLVTVVLADLDGLKFINDCYGHGEGDLAIATVAAALRHACPPQALCVRFGGDEMLAVIDGECDQLSIKERLNSFLEARNSEFGKPYEISASVGIYAYKNPGELDFEELIKTSDKLMYEEKQLKKKLREKNMQK
ncbi:MAG: GGDEF domain-containing protein [Oscillospiraceae bacterium]|nr:GGDEF domain-containing protein [Oscillospiraceae bacterium]